MYIACPNFMILIQIILSHPCTSTTSERSFSYLRMVKTYLQNRIENQRLSDLTLLNFYPVLVNEIDLIDIANKFVTNTKTGTRERQFGKFIHNDVNISCINIVSDPNLLLT